jgi:hypothetical protein
MDKYKFRCGDRVRATIEVPCLRESSKPYPAQYGPPAGTEGTVLRYGHSYGMYIVEWDDGVKRYAFEDENGLVKADG